MRPLLLLGLALLIGCPSGFEVPADSVTLSIPDRPWAKEAPPEGWCGEASIQMAALFFGAHFSQARIHRAGGTARPDLWEDDLPRALKVLGLRFETGPTRSPAKLLRWTVERLREGQPVILGLKMVPSGYPEWEVDHLVLVVGFSPSGLLINTNMKPGQVTTSWTGLQHAAGTQGLSLVNQTGTVFGIAITGLGSGAKT